MSSELSRAPGAPPPSFAAVLQGERPTTTGVTDGSAYRAQLIAKGMLRPAALPTPGAPSPQTRVDAPTLPLRHDARERRALAAFDPLRRTSPEWDAEELARRGG
jgi:hypothetical protein